ncbi:hypothetical protein EJ05DRAFT_475575 [Pseudovirgaria hyperparasitica]|uniref:Uncharacterized protein n=1 Tax=Pseudovirgaria hyperparasitica TaxID=470096 RepID=A0A6A6W9K3_9PEZI|nr:uncharacterized protein EJ05DRAFT_475575 [Pseudovirgaria hyperparasitica]KAF2759353.1 hypothetical protein EJ05DRAFT_475575 [Pseudovirgaria hyperparasitica]
MGWPRLDSWKPAAHHATLIKRPRLRSYIVFDARVRHSTMPKLVTILVAVFVVGCLLTNVDAQYAFVIPNPDLADFDPRNDVEQYSVHNFEWSLDRKCLALYIDPS